jgi:uncharacterized protein YabN with tetrapyrrole methylase and pyrophosphatase domain
MPGQQRNSRDEGSFSKPADPLGRALHAQRGAASLNFDWPDAHGALQKLLEEIEELEALLTPDVTSDPAIGEAVEEAVSEAVEEAVSEAVEEEVGDLLFAAINVARLCDVPPGPALSSATEKFERRFGELLSRAKRQGIDPRRVSLEELDALWESVKREERERA